MTSAALNLARNAHVARRVFDTHSKTFTNGREVVCILKVPQRNGRPLVFRGRCAIAQDRDDAVGATWLYERPEILGAYMDSTPDVVGWFGSSIVRKATHKATSIVKKVVPDPVERVAKTGLAMAKAVAKSKAMQTAIKTSPLWLNAVPPPAGQALAAGAAAGLAVAKTVDMARRGVKSAKDAITRAKTITKSREGAKRVAVEGAKILRTAKVPPPAAAKALAKKVDAKGVYTVKTPSGREFKFTAGEL